MQYRLLLPACSEELVERVVAGDLTELGQGMRERPLQQYHSVVMRKMQLQSLTSRQSSLIWPENLRGLIQQYPSKASAEPKFSASMDFAFTVLRKLANSDMYEVEDKFFIDDLVQPLLRRAIKKHVDWGKIQEIVDLMMMYLEAHPTAGEVIISRVDDVRHLLAQCWAQQPHLFEKQLKRSCSHPVFGTHASNSISDWRYFLKRIPSRKRYPLLRLVFKASTGLDLDVDADLKRSKGALGYTLLAAIGIGQALSLFLRLRKARGDKRLAETGPSYSILSIGSPDLYHIVLQSRNSNSDEAERLAESYIEDLKKKAASAAQPEQRGSYARSALFAAIGSGSLIMVQEVFEWNKRFLRDPLALKELSSSNYPKETTILLSGIPPLKSSFSVADLRSRIEQANSILVYLFDTACSALQEPSFYYGDWKGVCSLFQSVVHQRIKLPSQVKTLLRMSEDEVYRNLWETTISMLISVEEKANQEGHERLDANHLRGILNKCGVGDLEIQQDPENTSTMRFLDELAKTRDELWRKLRPERYPTAAVLPTPLPLGLPVQDLTAPWVLDVQDLGLVAPYLASRVKATLFPDPMEALRPFPTDEESQKAIGIFIDSYQYALRLYVPKSCDKTVREVRLRQVWNYATGALSKGRMTAKEAARFWDTKLSATISQTNPDRKNRKLRYQTEWPPRNSALSENGALPLIPEVDDPKKPSEWNPFAVGSPTLPSRHLEEPTYIDVALTVPSRSWGGILGQLNIPKPEVPASEMNTVLKKRKRLTGSDGSIAGYRNVRRRYRYTNAIPHASRKVDEGSVMAALLYLDTKFRSTNKRLLESVFPQLDSEPEVKDFRYPSLYLDDDFLSDETLDPRSTVHAIRGHLNQIPPVLLHQLTSNVMVALEASDPTESIHFILQEVAILLMVRLEESDRPSLAAEMAITATLDRPQSSSWHRQLLKPSFLQRLPARQSRSVVEAFVKRILDKASAMHEQKKQAHDGAISVAQTYLGRSALKVSTIKFLAQLLRHTGAVSEEYAFTTLSALFQKATHLDVRSNIIYSLLDMFQYGSKERLDDILTALEPAILLAGNLNEREPVTEDHWRQAEKDTLPPETQEERYFWMSWQSPVLNELFSFFGDQSINSDRSRPFLDRILLPTIQKLKEQTTKWVTLFLRRHGVDQATQDTFHIPAIPRDEVILHMLLIKVNPTMNHIPRALLEEWVDYVTFRCAPPDPLRALNKRFRDDPASRSNPDVNHWLNLYGDEINATNLFTNSIVQSALESKKPISQDSGITPEFVQKQFMRIFTAILWNDSPLYESLHSLVQGFLKHHCLVRAWWQPHGTTIIEAMIAEVDRIRTKEWQRDSKRKPSTLPDTLSWRLLLLDCSWPENNDTKDDREKKCKHFADQIAVTIDDMVAQHDAIAKVLYHKRLDELKKFLKWSMVSSSQTNRPKPAPLHTECMNNGLLTAIQLGHIAKTGAGPITTPDMLKINVAIYLVSIIEGFHKVEKDLTTRFELIIDKWKICENEDVRKDAYELVAKHNLSEIEGRDLLEDNTLQLDVRGHQLGMRTVERSGCPEENLIDYSDEDVEIDEML